MEEAIEKLELIDLGYAKVYIDRSNEPIEDMQDYLSAHLSSEYYKSPGSIQWNYYLFYFGSNGKLAWESNDTYCRKFVNRHSYFDWMFPEYNKEEAGVVTVHQLPSKGHGVVDLQRKWIESHPESYIFYPSGFSDMFTDLDALLVYDKIRAMLIKGQSFDICTHDTHEIFLLRKKFDFLGDGFRLNKLAP